MSEPFTEKVAAYFKARPGQFIDGKTIALIGGGYGWRSRISDCRLQLGMDIQNRQRRFVRDDGTRYTISEYVYVPKSDEAKDDGFRLTA